MVSLYCGVNVLNIPSVVSHFSCFACVSVSNNCNLFLHSLFFIIAIFSGSGTLYNLNILFTSSLKFLSSFYLYFYVQLNVGCCITGSPMWGPNSVLCCFLHWLQLWPVSLPLLYQLLLVLCSFAHLPSFTLYACLYLPIWDYDLFSLPNRDHAYLGLPIWDIFSWYQ